MSLSISDMRHSDRNSLSSMSGGGMDVSISDSMEMDEGLEGKHAAALVHKGTSWPPRGSIGTVRRQGPAPFSK